jgi:ABC-2 type transport system permease protein
VRWARRSVIAHDASAGLLVFPILFPLILFAINGSALSAATRIPGFPPVSYRAFLLAVPFMQGALFVAVTAGVDLARDIESGFFNRLAMTPVRASAMLAGQMGGPLVVAAIQSVIYLLVGIATGVGIASGVGGALRAARALDPDRVRVRRGRHAAGAAFGSGEAVQAMFPLLFVTLFLSSSSLPAQPDEGPLVSLRRDLQPGLLPDRGHPQPRHHRLGRAGAGARVWLCPRARADRSACLRTRR